VGKIDGLGGSGHGQYFSTQGMPGWHLGRTELVRKHTARSDNKGVFSLVFDSSWPLRLNPAKSLPFIDGSIFTYEKKCLIQIIDILESLFESPKIAPTLEKSGITRYSRHPAP
jgi:hypothetical protein